MAKMNDIRFLARETAKEVSGSPRDWMRYLDTASRLYRYPFADTTSDPCTAPGRYGLCGAGSVE